MDHSLIGSDFERSLTSSTFDSAAPTETCNVDTLMVRTVLSSAPITNTILHCAATTALGSTATVASTLTTASVVPTETSEGNSHATRKARSDRKDSMESTLLEVRPPLRVLNPTPYATLPRTWRT